ncbi:MAG: hypothetical protein IKF38_04475 [Clostridia bacterium]|nr:hypothetical protein [Clostridia bacterium]
MFWNKKESEINNNENKQQTKKKKPGSFDGVKELSKMIFKKRDYKIEAREISKEDKKAALITAAIIIGIGLLLWFLPFTHQFFEDIIFLRT